jgi:hypothetical protein
MRLEKSNRVAAAGIGGPRHFPDFDSAGSDQLSGFQSTTLADPSV